MSDLHIPSNCYYPDFKHIDCAPVTPPGGGAGDDCITKWKDKKDEAGENLKNAIAEVQKRSEALKYALEWELKLKMYFDNIYKTSELSDIVAREVAGFKAQAEKVCTNADIAVTAIEMLFCEVRKIFEPCVRQLVEVMDQVNNCLKCITDPGLVRDKGILKVLYEYDQKLREIEALQLDTLKKIIEALKCANILYYSICAGEEGKEEYACDALINELEVLLLNFGNGALCNDTAAVPYSAQALTCTLPVRNCKSNPDNPLPTYLDVKLEPIPLFPLCKDPYYTTTKDQYDKALEDKSETKQCLDEAKTAKEGAQACYDSLVAAVETSEKAKNGK